ncbi:MAG: hypothetical protein M3Q07_26550 [Pseudobdellovibrionaceae bacterium]|nr:hypothetical protein [Pseudobdellovibrionaceae bacterium]
MMQKTAKKEIIGAAALSVLASGHASGADSNLQITKKNRPEVEHRFEKWNIPAISIFEIERSRPGMGSEPEKDGTQYLNPEDTVPEPEFLYMLGNPRL